ncbi:Putative exopolysaccharide Exporter (EPS-E) [Nonlabens sp. Hel1_33_55]|uniref:exopolysaccharide Pel transporter PelG n=1 Tax=Nonlabens sp. Hel1_33_55 TaxID=1336802 RepID=UPI000875AFA4|nr:exopolysaccharide Pel transporter PelG [Nonlabens sp. Hel1_33_55]SCY17882.1 Putative exopolysaccharide Exporter (EPS-E) [Nonlabens sp. Hel1_33_55]
MRTNAQNQQLKALIDAIKKRNGKPINSFVIIATIESFGIREMDLIDDYGFKTTDELAQFIFEKLDTPEFNQLKNENQLTAENNNYKRISINDYLSGRAGLFIKDYSIGMFHLLPVVIQIVAVILFGFSLWTFVGFNNLQSTAVVLGVILGLVATGGFVQATGKQVSFYWYNEDYQMTYRVIQKIHIIGLEMMAVGFAILAIINSFIRLFPFKFITITFIYAFLIGSLLLALAPLYTVKRRWMISVAVGISTLITLLLHWYTNLNTYLIHWIGILIGLCISILYLHYFFQNIIAKSKSYTDQIPRKALAVYRNVNYFIYGTLLYVFVFMDRIIAWSSHAGRELPYFIYYEPNYEIGMDLAILVFFLLAGVMEYSISSFSRFLEYHQRTERFHQFDNFNRKMMRHYKNHLALFLISGLLVFVALYLIVTQDWGYEAAFNGRLNDLSLWVCAVGSLGYFMLTLGMLNVLYLYTLNRHKTPVIFIICAILLNGIIGIAMSRWISYEYAAVGMLAGSILFAAWSTLVTFRFFKKLDYYYYAAY